MDVVYNDDLPGEACMFHRTSNTISSLISHLLILIENLNVQEIKLIKEIFLSGKMPSRCKSF